VRDAVHKDCTRTGLEAEIISNIEYKANYFPKESFFFRVRGKGFLRYQIRMMMGALVLLGKGALSQEKLKTMLGNGTVGEQHFIAPGSGLFLAEMEFDL
jgi:tRNA pseudouridine38-40 synthase